MTAMIKIGISSCLIGNNVRYNGGHKLDRYIRDTLGRYFQYIPVCPEIECGLPVPREPIRLVGDPSFPRLLSVITGIDYTERMLVWARKRVQSLKNEHLYGFIFKKNSPSCGMTRVKVYNINGCPVHQGIGVFAKMFMDHFPLLPVEDEDRLRYPETRNNFIERIFTCFSG